MIKSKTFVLISLLFFLIKFPIFSDEKSADKSKETEETIVFIESAKKTEYKKIEEEEVVIFTGDVKLSVSKPSQEIYIEADNVTFNRNRSTIYAEGNVVFTELGKGKDESQESLTASSLLFNTDTMEGVFDSARVVQESSKNINLTNGATLIVSSELFGKENSGTITFKNGVLTFCDDENPHWKIKASRIWLLPGNEFSFFNALLFVGNLPIFYMPFFYYPKDEMIFNPVFGYRPREGYFVQTTTYLIGRKPLDSSKKDDDEPGIYDFMKTTDLMEQEREGLFLKNTDEKATMPKNSLKLMADLYSTLGGMIGIDGVFEDFGIVNSLSFGTYLGFSNTLFPKSGNNYSKYSATDKTYYNKSHIFGLELPFRFYANFKLSISKSPFTLNVDLPLYSDSWFKYDFLDRSEYMDWISFLLDDKKEEDNETPISEISSYSWNLSGSISKPKWVSKLSPFVENISLSSVSSSVNFISRVNKDFDSKDEDAQYSPERKFFAPSSVYPLKTNFVISGKILSLSDKNTAKKNTSGDGKANFIEILDNPINRESKVESTENPKTDDTSKKLDEKSDEIETFIGEDFLPKISVTKPNIKSISNFTYNLGYSIKPQFTSEINYFTDKFNSPKDIDMSNVKMSFIKLNSPINLSSKLSLKNDFISIGNNFDFNPVYQNHPSINPDYAEKNGDNIKKSDYNARKLDLTNSNTVKIMPFVLVDEIKNFSLSWNTSLKLITTKFTGDIENPSWEYEKTKWEPEYITKNNLSATISANQFAETVSESLTLTANLPPLTDSYSAVLKFVFPFCTNLQFGFGYRQKSKTDESWVFDPITQSSSWSFFENKLKINQRFSYNVEDSHVDNFSTSINGYGLTFSYTMSYTNPYDFDSENGTWICEENKEFLPYELRINYSSSNLKYSAFAEKFSIAPTLSTDFTFDLIQITDSYFSFTPGFTIKINDFLNFSFSSESRNDVIFRYVQDYVDMGIEIPGETNVFKDLFNSFAFGDKALREASGFKLKKLKMTLSHDLHDWTLNSSFTLEPRLIKTSKPYRYDFSPYFTLSVSWNPMSSIKTTVEDKYGEFLLY